jgi:transposase
VDEIEQWAQALHKRFGGTIAIALELSKGLIVSALQKYDFITRWPTLKQLKRARKNTLEKFFHEHNMRFSHILDTRLESIKAAKPLTLDAAIVTPYSLQALVLTDQLRVSLQAIRRYDDEIAELAPKHPDCDLFSALPGAGPSMAPRLLVAFGEQRDRFDSAAALQKYAGIAPVTERSGKKHWVHWRWQC